MQPRGVHPLWLPPAAQTQSNHVDQRRDGSEPVSRFVSRRQDRVPPEVMANAVPRVRIPPSPQLFSPAAQAWRRRLSTRASEASRAQKPNTLDLGTQRFGGLSNPKNDMEG